MAAPVVEVEIGPSGRFTLHQPPARDGARAPLRADGACVSRLLHHLRDLAPSFGVQPDIPEAVHRSCDGGATVVPKGPDACACIGGGVAGAFPSRTPGPSRGASDLTATPVVRHPVLRILDWLLVAGAGAAAPAAAAGETPGERLGRPLVECATSASASPFRAGWVVSVGYELGRLLEPAVVRGVAAPSGGRPVITSAADGGGSTGETGAVAWPVVVLQWCPAVAVFDHRARRWHLSGAFEHATSAAEWLASGVGCSGAHDPDAVSRASVRLPGRGDQPPVLRPELAREQAEAAIARAIAYIHAGDIFQANLTQRFTVSREIVPAPRELLLQALTSSGARYGAWMERLALHASGDFLLSLSPELFLAFDPATRLLLTRPIKGTAAAAARPETLAGSAKDAAELTMIVDLMRNDLGRVCEPGSVRVDEGRAIETHPTVHHGVATVSGRVRQGVRLGDILQATFPPGSVTGAPKIRAMQIIEQLEPAPRGPYCGAIGFIGDDGGFRLNVAIRTLYASGDRLLYGAGGGIVSDSLPQAEYDEAMLKTRAAQLLLGAEGGG